MPAAPPTPGLPTIAATALQSALERDPVGATYLGDHERDELLPDPSGDAAQVRVRQLRTLLAELDALTPAPSGSAAEIDDTVDAAVLRTVLAGELFALDELREDRWNPMLHNPGPGLHALLSRPFAPLPDRLAAAAGRLAAVPDYLAAARARLDEPLPEIHTRTALGQLEGAGVLVDLARAGAAEQDATLRRRVEAAADAARAALDGHCRWLESQGPAARRSARLGPDLFRERLTLALDTAFDPADLLVRARDSLAAVEAQIVEQAGRLAGVPAPTRDTVRDVLADLARDAPTDETVLAGCAAALAETTAFVRDRDLVGVYDDVVEVVAMPEIDRGVAVAYCRPNGPLETARLPTEVAVSPTPAGWPPERVASFYREYNAHMLQDLMVHEAMPGHALQLMHSNRHAARTPVRSVWPSGSFVEGWAVYAEELMAGHGYRGDVSGRAAAAVRLHQLKMQLRMTINTILDIEFHCGDLDESGALELMQQRGYQEAGEAIGKWQRVQLTSTQLCTYYVGYLETAAIAADLAAHRPHAGERERHDAMLAHGSPPPRHLRTLLGLPSA